MKSWVAVGKDIIDDDDDDDGATTATSDEPGVVAHNDIDFVYDGGDDNDRNAPSKGGMVDEDNNNAPAASSSSAWPSKMMSIMLQRVGGSSSSSSSSYSPYSTISSMTSRSFMSRSILQLSAKKSHSSAVMVVVDGGGETEEEEEAANGRLSPRDGLMRNNGSNGEADDADGDDDPSSSYSAASSRIDPLQPGVVVPYNVDRDRSYQTKRPVLVVAHSLKIVAAVEMEEQPSNFSSHHHSSLRRRDILDEIILWPKWRKWINLSTLTAFLAILATTGVIGVSWHHARRKRNATAQQSRSDQIKERLAPRIDPIGLDVDNDDWKNGPYHRALQWLATEDARYQEHEASFLGDNKEDNGGDDDDFNNDLLQRFSMAAIYFATTSVDNDDDEVAADNNDDTSWIRCGHRSHRCEPATARWLGPDHECLWAGVKCNALDRIVAIDMHENGLVGEFPKAVSYLWELDTLMLEHGQLRGTIPNLPVFKTLRVLELSNNTITGTIPSFMAQSASLEIIDLSFNKMTGTIAPSFFALPFLDRLELHDNALRGPLHRLIDDLPDSLEHLALYDNDLSGSIPSTVSKLSNLKYISLDKMAITGTIPSEIRALTNLEDLGLLNVLVTPQDFPVALYELPKLIFIDLHGCNLRGNLTNAGVAMWQNLWFFDASNNALTGPFPTAFKDTKYLEVLNLSGNRWSGSVPSELCHIIDIKVGCLSGNEVACPCCKACCDDDSGICAGDGWHG